jgi:hypothetical protein
MALVACKECGKEMSDQAAACPGCGAPPKPVSKKPATRKTSPVAWAAAFAIIAGLVWYTTTRDYKEQSLPPIPVDVKFRQALLGPGMVLQVHNTSDRPIVALVNLSNPTTQQRKSFRVDVAGNGTSEIGHQEGWTLAVGDNVEVFNDAYRSWTGTIR